MVVMLQSETMHLSWGRKVHFFAYIFADMISSIELFVNDYTYI